MSEMEQLERQLHGWALRHPSARLERRIFRRSARQEESTAQPLRLGWLAPVTAILMMFTLLIQRNGTSVSGGAGPTASVAMMVSNHSALPFLPAGLSSNRSGESFEWTNGNGSTSSISSLSGSRGTN